MNEEQGQYLAAIDPQPGDVVRCVYAHADWFTEGKQYAVQPDGSILDDDGEHWWNSHSLFVKVPDAPKLRADMTPTEEWLV